MSLLLKPQLQTPKEKPMSEDELKVWRASVLKHHLETNQLTQLSIQACRSAREKIAREARETRETINRWQEYSEKIFKSSRRVPQQETLSQESEYSDQLPRSAKDIGSISSQKMFFHRRNQSASRPTQCYLVKTRKKFAPKTHLRSFHF